MEGYVVIVTFDVEYDCPPYLSTSRGVEEGLPLLLDIMREEHVKATFFTTGRVALNYPGLVKRVVDEGHELGCHGYMHERLDKLPLDGAAKAIEKATTVLSRFADVASFRAPNLKLPTPLLDTLLRLGYIADSSNAKYKQLGARPMVYRGRLARIPASVTSSVLRLPWRIQKAIHLRLRSPIVYFSHPWEYVDMSREPIRYDCRFNTGERAAEYLRMLIRLHRERGAVFRTMREEAEAMLSPGRA